MAVRRDVAWPGGTLRAEQAARLSPSSIAEALQYISYFHPPDFVRAMSAAWEREENAGAKQAMAQILVNSRMCAIGRRPICQDTGSANIHVRYGVQAKTDFKRSLQEICDEGTRQGYLRDTNPLRASVVVDPFGDRKNSGDNTPCMLTVEMVAGDKIEVEVAAKGGGSENKTRSTCMTCNGAARRTEPRSCASRSRTGSMRSASARRGSAA